MGEAIKIFHGLWTAYYKSTLCLYWYIVTPWLNILKITDSYVHLDTASYFLQDIAWCVDQEIEYSLVVKMADKWLLQVVVVQTMH